MESAFWLAKELKFGWHEIQDMEARDRIWFIDRLEKFFKEREKQMKEDTSTKQLGYSSSRR